MFSAPYQISVKKRAKFYNYWY